MSSTLKQKKSGLLIASSIAILFLIFNFILISNGHFHEDAYILFIYVENFVNGNGITYYSDGPHIEGATDFLWLMLLIFLVKLGLNVGTSVILLNSVGVFIISYLLNIEISNTKIKNKKLLLLLYPFVFLWIFQQPLVAAVGGFSVFLYMALILLAFVSVYKEKYVLYTPYIGLIIALFRPDGVIIGIGFTLVGLYIAYKKQKTKQYIAGIIFGLVVGISYFVWRYNYFENLLPLPLHVKSHGSLTAGLVDNYAWIKTNSYLLVPLFLLAFFNKKIKYYLFLASPVILLFIALITVTQSQNIGFRFQAPVLIIAYYILILLIIEYMEKYVFSKFFKFIFAVYVFGFMALGLKHLYDTRSIVHFSYINQAPLNINKILPNRSTIALTEAGRMAYGNQLGGHKIIDLVGLNSEFPAKNTISIRYLEGISPEVLMYHHARKINMTWLNNYDVKVVLLDDKDKKFLINKKTYSDIERNALSKVDNASIVATQYLQKYFNEYDIFIVDYFENKSYYHVYAFKKTLLLSGKIHTVLKESFQRGGASVYYNWGASLSYNDFQRGMASSYYDMFDTSSYYEMLDKLEARN